MLHVVRTQPEMLQKQKSFTKRSKCNKLRGEWTNQFTIESWILISNDSESIHKSIELISSFFLTSVCDSVSFCRLQRRSHVSFQTNRRSNSRLFHSEQHTTWNKTTFYLYFLLEVLHVWSNCSSVRVRWVPLILNSHDLPMFVLHGPCLHWLPVTVCSVFTWLQWNLHTEDKLGYG